MDNDYSNISLISKASKYSILRASAFSKNPDFSIGIVLKICIYGLIAGTLIEGFRVTPNYLGF